MTDPGFDVRLSDQECEAFLGKSTLDHDVSWGEKQQILVTGAGGSLGRLITLKLLRDRQDVVALDRSEKGLFYLQQLVKEEGLSLPTFVVKDLSTESADEVFSRGTNFDAVVHAAAHKHVGFMEFNEAECLRNNVDVSQALFAQAQEHGVPFFVFLSTDKAVDAISVMGKSKARAEHCLHEMADDQGTRLATLRLPNVLGSDGSVVQIFRRQILLARALTITDPEAKRLFVSPQDAVSLVASVLNTRTTGTLIPKDCVELSVRELSEIAQRLWSKSESLETNVIGLQDGERMQEFLLGENESAEECEVASAKRIRVS